MAENPVEAVDDGVTHAIIKQLETRRNEFDAQQRKINQIIRCLHMTTLDDGVRRYNNQTDESLTVATRQTMFTRWIAKAREILA